MHFRHPAGQQHRRLLTPRRLVACLCPAGTIDAGLPPYPPGMAPPLPAPSPDFGITGEGSPPLVAPAPSPILESPSPFPGSFPGGGNAGAPGGAPAGAPAPSPDLFPPSPSPGLVVPGEPTGAPPSPSPPLVSGAPEGAPGPSPPLVVGGPSPPLVAGGPSPVPASPQPEVPLPEVAPGPEASQPPVEAPQGGPTTAPPSATPAAPAPSQPVTTTIIGRRLASLAGKLRDIVAGSRGSSAESTVAVGGAALGGGRGLKQDLLTDGGPVLDSSAAARSGDLLTGASRRPAADHMPSPVIAHTA